ncbi:MAG: alanine racemase [bacterium]
MPASVASRQLIVCAMEASAASSAFSWIMPPNASAEVHEGAAAQRPTAARIDLHALAQNVRMICGRVQPAAVMAVVKADGYGHGAAPVAQAALQAGATQLGVALLEEAKRLREQKIAVPILVLGGLFENQIEQYLAHDVQMMVYDFRLAEIISQRAQALGKSASVHVKIDTGMGRVGVQVEPVAFIEKLITLPGISLQGVCTHLATSDEAEQSYARLQLRRFRTIVQELQMKGIAPRWIHAANSGAILSLPDSYFNLVRPGVAMYGYYPSPDAPRALALQPAMSLHTRVLFAKRVPANTFVSYGRTFQTRKPSIIATLPLGYADGFPRRFSNNMEVLVRGKRRPIVGRVCMDQIMVDLGEMQNIQAGEEVVLMGKQGEEEISIYEWCRKLDTIPYEVTCGISRRVPRVFA